jgi:hypothetical protein
MESCSLDDELIQLSVIDFIDQWNMDDENHAEVVDKLSINVFVLSIPGEEAYDDGVSDELQYKYYTDILAFIVLGGLTVPINASWFEREGADWENSRLVQYDLRDLPYDLKIKFFDPTVLINVFVRPDEASEYFPTAIVFKTKDTEEIFSLQDPVNNETELEANIYPGIICGLIDINATLTSMSSYIKQYEKLLPL